MNAARKWGGDEAQLTLEDPTRRAPSGPAVEPPLPKANTIEAYRAWRQTADGVRAFGKITEIAELRARSSDGRVSINAVVEEVRATTRLPINNTYRAWIADELVARWPHIFENVIERRRRKVKPGL